MIDVLKGIDRALGAIFDGDSTGTIEEIKSITAGGVLTTINYKEDGEGDSWTSYFYDVTVLLPFTTIPKDDTPVDMKRHIETYADDNKIILQCGEGAEAPTAEMITIIDITPYTDTPIIVGKRRFIIVHD
jgi:hypothetical protein